MAGLADHLGRRFNMRMWLDPDLSETEALPLVLNKTGLKGKFKFRLEFGQLLPARALASVDPGTGTSIYTSLEKQLGLRLEKGTKGQRDYLIVDHAEKVLIEN